MSRTGRLVSSRPYDLNLMRGRYDRACSALFSTTGASLSSPPVILAPVLGQYDISACGTSKGPGDRGHTQMLDRAYDPFLQRWWVLLGLNINIPIPQSVDHLLVRAKWGLQCRIVIE